VYRCVIRRVGEIILLTNGGEQAEHKLIIGTDIFSRFAVSRCGLCHWARRFRNYVCIDAVCSYTDRSPPTCGVRNYDGLRGLRNTLHTLANALPAGPRRLPGGSAGAYIILKPERARKAVSLSRFIVRFSVIVSFKALCI